MASRLHEARALVRQLIIERLEAEGFPGLGEWVEVDVPTEKGHGDLTSSFAMKVARYTKLPPVTLAERILATWPATPLVESVSVAGPGFFNVTLKTRWMAEVVNLVRANPDTYGNSDIGNGARVLLEFVSANPTGPLVVVSGRAAAVGDAMARLMEAAGFRTHREFYVNDAGNQIRTFGQAMWLRLRELALGEDVESHWPEGVYPGEYVKDLAEEFLAAHPETDVAALGESDFDRLGAWAAEKMRSRQEAVLARFGVQFDRWFSERQLRESGAVEAVIQRLQERGYLEEREGALWFLSTRFGDDKDRVMVKSDGSYTYFVPDAAYHADKFDRGFDYVIDLLGPDHHGYVARMRAVVEALGFPRDRLEILIIQLVRLVKAGQVVRMSKRRGQFFTLEELLDEAGVDPTRYFLLERAPETPMDFDMDLAGLRGTDNPVYYIQYAGARIHSILRQWQASGQMGVPLDLSYLTAPEERTLLFLLAQFPDVIARAAIERAPHLMPRYLTELAGAYHAYYRQYRVLEETPPVRQARLALSEAVLAVITRGLNLLGISQPEKM